MGRAESRNPTVFRASSRKRRESWGIEYLLFFAYFFLRLFKLDLLLCRHVVQQRLLFFEIQILMELRMVNPKSPLRVELPKKVVDNTHCSNYAISIINRNGSYVC